MVFHLFPCIFTIYGCVTNSRRDQLPVGLIAHLVEHRYRRDHGFESRSSLNFFQALISQLKLTVYFVSCCRWEHLVYQLGGHDNVIKFVTKNGKIVHRKPY